MTKAKFAFLLATLAAALLVAAGCGGGGRDAKAVPSDAIAVVGDDEITKDEFDNGIEQQERAYKAQNRKFPEQGTQDYNLVKDSVVRYLVRISQYDQKAGDLGIEVTDQEVESRLEQYKKQYKWNDEQYRRQLEAQGLTDEEFRNAIRYQLLSEKIFAKVTADVKVDDSAIDKYYKKNRSQYRTPPSREVRHILVKRKALAERLYRQLTDGASFARLAKKYSQDPGSKSQGGKLTVARGQTVPPFDRVAFSLDVHEISQPVKTQYGFHIIEALTKTKPARVTPLSQVRESIRQQLLQDKKNQALTDWIEELDKELKPRYQVGYQPQAASASQQ
jgi:parvulin-like peptidyl-prolyl isomerase